MNKIYIAGVMRGKDPALSQAQFAACEQALLFRGLTPLNPWNISIPEVLRTSAQEVIGPAMLRIDIAKIARECSGMALLDGWTESTGAKAEVAIAMTLGFQFYNETGEETFRPDYVLVTDGYDSPPRQMPVVPPYLWQRA